MSVAASKPRPLHEGNTLADLTASEALAGLAAAEFSAHDYAAACADRIEQFEPTVHAWAWYAREALLAKAARADERLAAHRKSGARGALPGALSGVPVGVKDVFNTYDMPTSMGSEILAGYTPGNDARIVSDVRRAGAIVAGKTVTAEFAVHAPGPTVNPHDPARTPGTSSSGSAAAVALGMVPLALATQTAGSTIRPASYCGVHAFKPSFGVIARTAMLKTTDTLDTVGYMARSVDDLALLFEVVRVRGHNYPISEAALSDDARQTVAGRPWRVGLVRAATDRHEAAAPRAGLDRLARRLQEAGCEVAERALPAPFDAAQEVHEQIYRRALAYYFKSEWESTAEKFSPRLAAMIEAGLRISPDRYAAAIDRQRALAHLFDAQMADVDVLLCLSTADEAPVGLELEGPPDTCLIWTMCGAPTIGLPLLSGENGLPVGVQIVARRYNDYLLLRFAKLLEQVA